ncbi:LacI family DNA-binding transcriptional regulator [Spirochaeta africana]|uniref:Transcriptional regulator n=1 Tax=Spirochaeta africana (strain ATCC 700263 / DSM 8902 / Z-7692) TaxID=889378 RepID=H9UL96_SPIAZ|nr:LacI family DNA-binding transcriptional regulator [Spirochaeta africana]AFG38289.1 transcriptional regulator [Spirochaeta africana DSM 8902]
MPQRVTIKDIALQAGVGTSTVSRVLNGDPLVKESTRRKVLDICAKMHYVPSESARMLVQGKGRRNTVALLLPTIAHQYFYEIISSLQKVLSGSGQYAMVFNTHHGDESVVHHIIAMHMSAVVVLGDSQLSDAEKELLRLHHIHLLYVDRYEPQAHCITYNNHTGGALAAEYLIERGCSRVLMIGIVERTQQQHDRFSSFRRRFEELAPTGSCADLYAALEEDSYTVTRHLLHGSPEIDGIFYFSDLMAYGGLQARRDTNTCISIIGYDDIFPSQFMELTTVAQPPAELGRRAADLLLELLAASDEQVGQLELQQVCLEPYLVQRSQ